jgi:protein SCO1/2
MTSHVRHTLFALAAGSLLTALTACASPPEAAAKVHEQHEIHAEHDSHAAHEPLPAATPLPGRSLYHLQDTWLDQHGREMRLADLRGHGVVAVMFYASCETACPILIRDALRLEQELPAAERDDTQFLMITIDPENDAPERMARYVSENGLEAPNWHFLSGSEQQTRAIASLLGVSYRAAGGGMFSHTNLITVLDRDGMVVQRTEGLARPLEPAIRALRALTASAQ